MNKLNMKGGSVCCVKNCTNNSRGHRSLLEKKSFHKLPKDPILRNEWISRIQSSYEDDDVVAKPQRRIIWQPKKTSVVCGVHFNSSGIKQRDDILPVYLGNRYYPSNVQLSATKLDDDPEGLIQNIGSEVEIGQAVVEECAIKLSNKDELLKISNFDHVYFLPEDPRQVKEQLTSALSHIKELEQKVSRLQTFLENSKKENISLRVTIRRLQQDPQKNSTGNFSFTTISKDCKQLKYYTGFASTEEYNTLYAQIEPELANLRLYNNGVGYERKVKRPCSSESTKGRPMSLDFKNQLFLTLCKIRVGLPNKDLAYRFGISKTTVNNYFTTWLDMLYKKLTRIPIWPSRKVVDDYMPIEFKEKFPSTRVIIDCTEFFIETPSSYAVQSDTYSNYKRHNTAKGLIGITPNGFISFVSTLAPGRMSDSELTIESGLLALLEPNDSVMADRGFLVADVLKTKGVGLNIPPFLGGKPQLSLADEQITREIAAVRIHVERVIKELKDFRILKFTFPNSMSASLDKIWKVSCYLVNLISEPLLDVTRKRKDK